MSVYTLTLTGQQIDSIVGSAVTYNEQSSKTDQQKARARANMNAMKNVPVTASDNGKILQVVNGEWAAVEVSNARGVNF